MTMEYLRALNKCCSNGLKLYDIDDDVDDDNIREDDLAMVIKRAKITKITAFLLMFLSMAIKKFIDFQLDK